MLKSALIAVAALAVAAPGLASAKAAKKDTSAPVEANSGPIPYSELAAADAKMNPAAPARHHMAMKKASKDASPAAAAPPKTAQ